MSSSPFHDVVSELRELASKIEAAVSPLRTPEMQELRTRFGVAAAEIGRSWCGSRLGYHARIYLDDLAPAMAADYFNAEWGLRQGYSYGNSTRGEWRIFTYETVRDEIVAQAEPCEFESVVRTSASIYGELIDLRDELVTFLDATLFALPDDKLSKIREEAATDSLRKTVREQIAALPRVPQFSRDSAASAEGYKVPPHLDVAARVEQSFSVADAGERLKRLATRAALYVELKTKLSPMVQATSNKVLIGHGRSSQWRDLKDFLQDRLNLPYEEFNREPTAGLTVTERLNTMLAQCSFAFLVMTAEDEQADGKTRARENVVHEVGLCQAKYGQRRAIVLLEEGCEEFSNIQGLGQIRFPEGTISAKFEEIRRVLEREGMLEGPSNPSAPIAKG